MISRYHYLGHSGKFRMGDLQVQRFHQIVSNLKRGRQPLQIPPIFFLIFVATQFITDMQQRTLKTLPVILTNAYFPRSTFQIFQGISFHFSLTFHVSGLKFILPARNAYFSWKSSLCFAVRNYVSSLLSPWKLDNNSTKLNPIKILKQLPQPENHFPSLLRKWQLN